MTTKGVVTKKVYEEETAPPIAIYRERGIVRKLTASAGYL